MKEQYTVRIYDSNLTTKLEKIFSKCKDIYVTKNPFIVDCMRKGVEEIERTLLGNKSINTISDLYEELSLTIEKLNILTKLCEKNAKENMANLTVNQKMLSSSYNMLLGLSDDNPIENKYIEAGMYDELPDRFSELLEEMEDVYLKKDE